MLTQSQLSQIKTQANTSTVILACVAVIFIIILWNAAGISFGIFLSWSLITMTVTTGFYAYSQKLIDDNIEYLESLNRDF